jgi:signal transduction histidine kinase/PAS domain-containing protein
MPEKSSRASRQEAEGRSAPLSGDPTGDPTRDPSQYAQLVAELEAANATLQDNAATLEAQTIELEQQTEEAQALAEELELSNQLLQESAADAEVARDAAQAAERGAVAVLERVTDLFIAYDPDLRCRYLNPPAAALCRELGADPETLVGNVLWDVLPPLRGTAFETGTVRAVRDQRVTQSEAFVEPAGRWFRVCVYPSADGVTSYAEDITERKRVEQEAQFLDGIDAVLADALLDYDATLAAVTGHAVPTLADYASIDVLTDSGEVRRVVSAHRDPRKQPLVAELWRRYPYSASGEVGAPAVLRTGVPQLNPEFDVGQIEAFARSPDHLARLRELNPRSYLAVPLSFAGRTLGVLSLVMSDSGRRFDGHALDLARELARRAAAAVEGARLYREAERAREALTLEASRDALLVQASDVLASSLDYEQTLATVARLAVPTLADWCSVYTTEPDGAPRRITVAHADPAKVEWARELQRRYPPDPEASTGVAQVIRTGATEFIPEITDEMLRRAAIDAEHLRLMRDLSLTAVITVPLMARGHTVGALTLVSAESSRRYGESDVALAEELGRRAGVAVDNARLFDAERRARGDAERAIDRTQRLQTVAARLSGSMGLERVASAVLHDGMEALGATSATLYQVSADGTALDLIGVSGPVESAARKFPRLPLSASLPLTDAIRSRAPVYLETREDVVRRYPSLAGVNAEVSDDTWAAVPFMVGDRPVGGVVFGMDGPHAVSPDDRTFIMALAQLCAQTLERARLYEAEREARSVAETALEAKAAFLGTMSHELRTPVNAVLGYTELLETGVRGPIVPEQAEDLRRIRRASGHLLGLINDLLNYTKLEAHQVRFDLAPVAVGPVLLEAALMIEPQARAKGLAFEREDCDPALVARGDREKMLQVVLNLLSNAAKFTREGGTVRLSADASPDPALGVVRIVVRDSGRGIEGEQIERIFEPFVQVGRKLTSTEQGAGLGLAISRELARGMNGNLTVESVHGEGSTFTFTLPRAGG